VTTPDEAPAAPPAPDPGREAPAPTVLEVRGLHKRFGEREVLRGIDLTMAEHEVVCLIGASGSGKSTLLRCINGLERVEAGTIRFAGRPVTGRGANLNRLRREVGIVFQAFNLFPHMTVLANCTLAPRKVLGLSRAEAEARATALLERIGLAELRGAYPDRLSGGQQQRVAIARALAMQPRLLLLDEVTSALDPELVGEVLALVGELAAGGMTMLIATHEMGFAREVATTVVFLEDGRIAEAGPPQQVFTAPANPRTAAFLRRVLDPGMMPR
jgi:polar amino acid transport system ATP-binding protein